jgi:hypothetical protein
MGYYVTCTDSNFVIPQENLGKAYEALCALNERDDLKTGGSWSGGKKTEKWFAWMDPDYPSTCPDAESIFRELGFETDHDSKGGLCILYYDNKSGSEDLFLEAVAPYADEGSYLVWRGEDGEMWRNVVRNGVLHTQGAVISWEGA